MKNNILKTASLMIILNLFSKVLGFLRDYFTAIKFGTTMEADAYLMASNIPNVMFVMIGIAITTTVIPVYNDIKLNKNKKELKDFTANIITILVIISIALTIICEIFAPQLVNIMAPGFIGEKLRLTVLLTRILASVILLNTTIYLFTAILQCEDNFLLPASIGIPYNIILIIYFIFLSDTFGAIGISIVVSLALIIQIFILMYGLKKINLQYNFYLNLRDDNIKKILKLLIPVCIGTGMTQINGIFNGIFASSLDSGSVAAINYALKLNTLIIDIIIVSVMTVVYQNITKVVSSSDRSSIAAEVNKCLVSMFIILIPIVILATFNCKNIVKILFQRGAFTEQSTILTSQAFYFYSLGLFAVAINSILSRVCYALQDTKTPMINTFFSVLINVMGAFLLKDKLGVGGIALASTIGTILSVIILYFNVRKKIPGCISKQTIISLGKLFIGCIPLILIIFYAKKTYLDIESSNSLLELIKLGITGGVGSLIYLITICLLRVNEITTIFKMILKK